MKKLFVYKCSLDKKTAKMKDLSSNMNNWLDKWNSKDSNNNNNNKIN